LTAPDAMKVSRALSAVLLLFAPSRVASRQDPHAKLVEKVRDIHGRVGKLLGLGALSGALLSEAKQVGVLADKASDASGDAALHEAIRGYETFRADLSKRESALRGAAPEPQAATLDERAATLVPRLEASVRRLLAHLEAPAAGASDTAEREKVVAQMRGALEVRSGEPPRGRVLRLHAALECAQHFLEQKTKALAAEESRLGAEVEQQRLKILMGMLKQRATLPMSTQTAMLRRQQFANDTYAQQLLKSHREDQPLYEQLRSMLPVATAQAFASSGAAKKDHLAVAGSDGRVHIVSSRLKNTVKGMVTMLRSARGKLLAIVDSHLVSDAEAAQAREIVAGLDQVLANVGKTNDLQTQLRVMDDMEMKLKKWMTSAMKVEHVAT